MIAFPENLERIRAAALALGALDETPSRLHPIEPIDPTGSLPVASAAQARFVWTVVAASFDPRVAAHLASALGPTARLGLSIAQHALVWRLSDDDIADVLGVLAPTHPIHALGLLVPQESSTLGATTPWRAPLRLWNHLRGDGDLDPLVAQFGGACVAHPGIASAAQEQTRARLAELLGSREPVTIILGGAPGTRRTTAVATAAAPRMTMAVDLQTAPPKLAQDIVVAGLREAVLLDAVPVFENLDVLWDKLEGTPEIRTAIAASLAGHAGSLVATAAESVDLGPSARTIVRQMWPLPDADTRAAIWRGALADEAGGSTLTDAEIDEVAARYLFGAGAILSAVRSARRQALAAQRARPAFTDVVDGVRANIAERLGEVARRVEVTQTWDELVLPSETHDDVLALLHRVRYARLVLDGWGFRKKLARGTGVAGLFSGPPGTGKTMVAGLIARELQLDLYQIDLSKIVSKWVGETEKQLARVFDAAEAGHALLLFDEADALFAKRSSDVKSAVDRYANLEVNYLLQRVESFNGVVLLTTNLDTSIDPALRRRLAAHITFTLPEYDERLRLWTQMIPPEARVEGDLRLGDLAQDFEDMSGANIRNAVLAGAFLAAGEEGALTFEHLRRGALGEYRSMGRVLGKVSR